jgi:hypothetical protein
MPPAPISAITSYEPTREPTASVTILISRGSQQQPPPAARGYIFPYIKGPANHNHDLALFKNFSLGAVRQILRRT